MRKISQNTSIQPTNTVKKPIPKNTDKQLHQLAFDNNVQANIITIAANGKIQIANNAACKLLGYSKKEILTKSRSTVFNIKESRFKKMFQQRTAEGSSSALVTAIKKNGKAFACEITSAVFMDADGIEKAITTLHDMTQYILDQRNIDIIKEKIVANNIVLAKSKQKGVDLKNKKNVADNISIAKSKQKDIDVKNKKNVAENISIAKSKQKDIDVKNKKSVADNISIAKSKQLKIDVKKDKIVAHNINVAKSKQIKVDIKKEKIVADNIVIAQAKFDFRLAENNEWIKYIAKTSYDVMWDWDLASQTIYVGESIHEVFGYKLKKNIMAFAVFCKCLVEEEREMVLEELKQALSSGNKRWKASFLFKRQDGTIASTICRASIVRDDTGKAIRLIGAIQDITILEGLERKLKDQITIQEAQGEKFLLAAKLSFDVIWDWDITTNEVFIGEGFEELFGYKIKDNKGHMISDWSAYMHPDDKKEIEKELYEAIRSTAVVWEHAYRVTRADGSIAKVYARASIIRHRDGKAFRMIGALQDLSKQKELEEKLDHEIKLKDRQINEATEDAKEMERSNIGKELHDNINQLLGASRMYLEMAKKGGNNSAMYLSRSSEYTLTAIEEIRKLSKGLTTDIIKNLGLCIAIDSLAIDMSEVNPVKISCSLEDFNEKIVTDKFKVNIFRIIQEHLNNILKHAQATKVAIHLSLKKNEVLLDITDNGIGFDTQKKQNGIGLENIKSRAATYNGTADFVSQPGKGCVLNIAFPIAV